MYEIIKRDVCTILTSILEIAKIQKGVLFVSKLVNGEEGHRTICSVKYLFGGDFILARIFGEIFCPLENSGNEFAKIM